MAYTDVAGDDTGDTGKVSQEECNYRRGTPMKHCGVCVYYEGDASKSCSRVEGPISGFGISDIFEMQKNPFGSRIGPQEAALIDQAMQSPKDQSPLVQDQQPGVQIGNRTY
jgi:hypothetical protein